MGLCASTDSNRVARRPRRWRICIFRQKAGEREAVEHGCPSRGAHVDKRRFRRRVVRPSPEDQFGGGHDDGQTGADDPGVDLDRGPVEDGDVIPGQILLGQPCDDGEADYSDYGGAVDLS